MKQQQKLTISMAIFFLFVFVSFGTIILYETKETLFLPKIEKKLNEYLEENYKELITTTNKDIKYKNNKYIMTITSKENKNLSFTIQYKNKEITDTYKKDYLEGQSYIKHLENTIEKQINDKTNKENKIKLLTTLDSMTTKIKEQVLDEKNLTKLKIYNLETEIPILNWTPEDITQDISNLINKYTKLDIIPKTYTIIITNKNNLHQSIKISNITTNHIKDATITNIINDIINDEKSLLLHQENITYEHLN